jgi:hypothetical protein
MPAANLRLDHSSRISIWQARIHSVVVSKKKCVDLMAQIMRVYQCSCDFSWLDRGQQKINACDISMDKMVIDRLDWNKTLGKWY